MYDGIFILSLSLVILLGYMLYQNICFLYPTTITNPPYALEYGLDVLSPRVLVL